MQSCYQSGNGWFTPNEYLEPGYLSVLTLMCRCYSGFLSTSDRPITNESKPLPLEELYNRGRGFVAFVTTHLELVTTPLRNSVSGCLSSLHVSDLEWFLSPFIGMKRDFLLCVQKVAPVASNQQYFCMLDIIVSQSLEAF